MPSAKSTHAVLACLVCRAAIRQLPRAACQLVRLQVESAPGATGQAFTGVLTCLNALYLISARDKAAQRSWEILNNLASELDYTLTPSLYQALAETPEATVEEPQLMSTATISSLDDNGLTQASRPLPSTYAGLLFCPSTHPIFRLFTDTRPSPLLQELTNMTAK
ncbi:hypothetical protein BKA62DRAFT_793535 [Auriculariales sp. MPI-PUGE-AT-0066]|nr:hypothetical protein BKA62DRAFT_793535 [Auriculariales sp. MPI-PUGE-AT-0066]